MKSSKCMEGAPPPYPIGEQSCATQYHVIPPPLDSVNPQYDLSGVAVPLQVAGAPPPIVVVVSSFGKQPMQIKCTHCGATVITETTMKPGKNTWLMFAICCILGCNLGCCLIPFCVDDFQDVEHSCPSCKTKLGTYKR